jgi:hypothetical protein
MHAPILYVDVRNRLKSKSGYMQTTAQFKEGLARAIFLLVRAYQDTCACERVMASPRVGGVPELFHSKIVRWIEPHFRKRELVVARGRNSKGSKAHIRVAQGTTLKSAHRSPRGVVPQYPSQEETTQHKRTLTPEELDYVQTGWPPALNFRSVMERVGEIMDAAADLPLPVWVPPISASFLPSTCTIYFGNAEPNAIAAATDNKKIHSVRQQAGATIMEALGNIQTWHNFLQLKFAVETITPTVVAAPSDEPTPPTSRTGSGSPATGFIRVVAPDKKRT